MVDIIAVMLELPVAQIEDFVARDGCSIAKGLRGQLGALVFRCIGLGLPLFGREILLVDELFYRDIGLQLEVDGFEVLGADVDDPLESELFLQLRRRKPRSYRVVRRAACRVLWKSDGSWRRRWRS